ncbi:MAG: carbamoyltransferase N-terminal domain-containing protein, partial [Bacteroidota bacterium]
MASSTYVLGINGGVRAGYQDVSAVLMRDGVLVAAIEEERLNRIKYSAGQLPILSVKEVLRIAGISIREVSVIAFHGSTWQASIEDVLKLHFESYFGFCPRIKRYHHHVCHAASTYYASGFEEALVITVDGSGDGVSTSISIGTSKGLQVIKEFERPQSLGIYYSLITQVCGFTRDADEYKLMGLAAYGNADTMNLDWVLNPTDAGYHFHTDNLVDILPGQPSPSRYEMLFSKKFVDTLGMDRRITNEISQPYKDLAAAAQAQLEKVLTYLVKVYVKQTGIRKVCMAG